MRAPLCQECLAPGRADAQAAALFYLVFSKKLSVVDAEWSTRLRELIEKLEEMAFIQGPGPDTTYVTINSDSIRLQLIEETLTDDSKVYNIELSEASK